MNNQRLKLLLTCEHGGNEIPASYQDYFLEAKESLNSHRGIDFGALDLFGYLKPLASHSHYSTTSRLLVELNRSLHHPHLFSSFTKTIAEESKTAILNDYYFPYRKQVQEWIEKEIKQGFQVLHVSVHSFTPELNGEVRNADIGLLYDPSRESEKAFCKRWKSSINQIEPALKVRFNYPYLGKADGFTTALRKLFPVNYSGIELEINQKWSVDNQMDEQIKKVVYSSLEEMISQHKKAKD